MKRVRLNELGWDAPLVLEEVEDPAVAEGSYVVVEVQACGVCHRDIIDRGGGIAFMRVPITLGHEVVGRIISVGPDVTQWRVGDRVATLHRDSCGKCEPCVAGDVSLCATAVHALGILADGGYATHLTVPERCLYAMPESLPAPEAAVLQCTYGTAYRGLRAGGCAPGRLVVITGAAGGVGSAAIEVATRMGARVVAVVRDEQQRAYAAGLGAADVVVDPGDGFHKHSATAGADLVLDCVGQPTMNSSLRCLRLGGTVIAIGNIVPERLSLNVGLVIVKALRIVGSSGATPRDMSELLALRGDRPFAIELNELPLGDADHAQRRLRQGGVRGRIVLNPA